MPAEPGIDRTATPPICAVHCQDSRVDNDPYRGDRIRERLEIVDAVSAVLDRRQELLEVIGAAVDPDAARQAIMTRFGLNEIQAVAVLDLQVRRFSQAERRRISDEAHQLRRELNRP